MDFGFTREEEEFRQQVLEFIEKEVPLDKRGIGLSTEDRMDSEEDRKFAESMSRKLGARGWLALTWPKEYGGQGRSHIDQLILSEEMTYHGAPGIDQGAVVRLGPVIMAYGTEEQKKRFLLRIARGEMKWAQGFSEPEAGSDLASLQTRAVESGDYFIVSGHKIWQSHGAGAEWCYFLARTDPNVPKHQGISYFVVDLKTPGITVRPLLNIVNTYGFSEIFFDDVKVPRENLIGKKNQGWQLTNATLNAERSGIAIITRCRGFFDEIVHYVKETPDGDKALGKNPILRQKLAQLAVELEAGRLLCYRVAFMQSKNQELRHESSISKQFCGEVMQRLSEVAIEILGLYGQVERDSKWARLGGMAERWYLSTRSRTIAGGTSEIQKTIIAHRGLGLPRG